jgi:iron complex transport system ATP-binding protein
MTCLDIDRASYSYEGDRLALSAASICVDDGEAVALIGPNGSGKSTLLRIASGSLRPASGEVRLDGTPIVALSRREIARRLAFVEQERTMSFDFTVREVVAMGRIPHHARFARESRADRRAIEDAMRLADVVPLAERSIRTLSGGEGQRVHLARAFAQDPTLLVLDEPTTYLDLHHQVRFMTIVRERMSEGLAALMAIHDLTIAAQAADRIALLDEGRIVVIGPPREVLTADAIRNVFGVEAIVGTHPELGTVYVLPSLADDPGKRAAG